MEKNKKEDFNIQKNYQLIITPTLFSKIPVLISGDILHSILMNYLELSRECNLDRGVDEIDIITGKMGGAGYENKI